MLGGPLYQLLRRARLEEDTVEVRLLRRIAVFAAVMWLPLLVLSVAEGTAFSGVSMTFFADIETHVRFLLVVPLLIAAELVVHRRIRGIVVQFIERGLVPDDGLGQFRSALDAATRWRNSIAAELLIIMFVLSMGAILRGDILAVDAEAWYGRPDGDSGMTTAGRWLQWVSTPLFQFLLLRWYFRMFIWARFLWQVSRIDLDLMPMHPDRNGGLGFLGGSAYAMAPLLMAHGAMVAAYAASLIFYQGASLADFKLEIVALVLILLTMVIGPLTVFAPMILEAKRKGLREYGAFAADYARRFDRRWLRGPQIHGEEVLGAADIQSLADLDAALAVVKSMTPLPVARDTILQLILAIVVPFAPLLLTLFPLEVLLDRIIGAVF